MELGKRGMKVIVVLSLGIPLDQASWEVAGHRGLV